MRSALVAVLLGYVALTPVAILHAQDVSSLALPERRGIKLYQETKLPELQTSINAAARYDVPLDIHWVALAQQGNGENYQNDDFFTNVYFVPLADALKKITGDALGAEGLKAKLKKVVVTYEEATAPTTYYTDGVKFEDGTLTLNFVPFTNPQDKDRRTQAMVSTLLPKLRVFYPAGSPEAGSADLSSRRPSSSGWSRTAASQAAMASCGLPSSAKSNACWRRG